MNGRSCVFQPMRPHSRTYQGFCVSFHRELISTMKTGAMETIRPVHTNQLFNRVAVFASTVTVLMDILLPNFDSLTHHLGTPLAQAVMLLPRRVGKNKRVLARNVSVRELTHTDHF